MNIREEMLAAARRAALPADRRRRLEAFIRSQVSPGGGFADRSGRADLYYTVFGIESLSALGLEVPRGPLRNYLEGFGDGAGLDLVHLACLVRCWSACLGEPPAGRRRRLLELLAEHRTSDGGYALRPGTEAGTAYGCFLALGICQDLHVELPRPGDVLAFLETLRAGAGGYGNSAGLSLAQVPATAAAATVRRHLDSPPEPTVAEWLLAQRRQDGGFAAAPIVPRSDLLSTATAVHTLAHMGVPLDELRGDTRAFVEGLWCDSGGFRSQGGEESPDCEYTFYALLTLGHLNARTG